MTIIVYYSSLNESDDLKIPELTPSPKVKEFDELPESIFTEPLQLSKSKNLR